MHLTKAGFMRRNLSQLEILVTVGKTHRGLRGTKKENEKLKFRKRLWRERERERELWKIMTVKENTKLMSKKL